MEKFSRLWTTSEIFTARGDKMCERFEDASVIQTVAIYTNILYAQHWKDTPEPEKNPTLTKIVNVSYTISMDMCLEPF